MRAFSFLHSADIHLGAPITGLRRLPPQLQDRLSDAPMRAFVRIVDTAIDADVAAVIIAGDLFDASEPNLSAQIRLRNQLERLDGAGIRTFIVAGNHDPLGTLTDSINHPPSVHLFGSTPECLTLIQAGDNVARICGVSYAAAAEEQNLTALFPDKPSSEFTIGVLHTNVGDRAGHARYAPCSLDDLRKRGVDYWALGHVHTRETLQSAHPVIHYPGNPQGLSRRDSGARGATLVQVSGDGNVELRDIHTDVVRWHTVSTSIEELAGMDDLLGLYAEMVGSIRNSAPEPINILRWTLTGCGPLHTELRRGGRPEELCEVFQETEALGDETGVVWLESLEVATRPIHNLDRLRCQQDYLGDMLRLAEVVREAAPIHSLEESDRDIEHPSTIVALREGLSEVLDNTRLVRALGRDPWQSLNWESLVSRAEAVALEKLAPAEED